uniref:Protein with signal anchor n=1 Tax=Panagrolaimus sp. PS1159 TaxID=55785 RepID=A0AC35F009_9BILA
MMLKELFIFTVFTIVICENFKWIPTSCDYCDPYTSTCYKMQGYKIPTICLDNNMLIVNDTVVVKNPDGHWNKIFITATFINSLGVFGIAVYLWFRKPITLKEHVKLTTDFAMQSFEA